MQIILFDTSARTQFYPFSLTRPLAAFRCGIFTIKERWEYVFKQELFTLTEEYLSAKYPFSSHEQDGYLYINASVLYSPVLQQQIQALPAESVLLQKEIPVAIHTSSKLQFPISIEQYRHCRAVDLTTKADFFNYSYDLVSLNDQFIRLDFELIKQQRTTASIPSSNRVIAEEAVFIEEGAVVEHCTFNASAGPIYIGRNSLLMEGSMIRGPFAALEASVVKMGSKIYGATTVGKQCTVGGEIKNTVFFDYSNKAHDGYIGDAVIGSWCNIGAGASCSNIKNTAGEVKLWNPLLHQWISAGTKCGVMLGDYSKVSINASLTTGMVSGICSNILTTGLSPKFINDFTWNIHTGETYIFEKAIHDIENWMQLKNHSLTNIDKEILEYLYASKLNTN
jgi:UDP-N-acetylglucosamine diphosphorylase/glucosamine-1-phosphate N-acetyltransferase